MLQTLDVLIGFTLVMLVVSMAVTMITQFISSSLFNIRGTALRQGLSRLMALMDQGLKVDEAARIIDHILRNPLIGGARLIGNKRDLATVVHREELIKLILDFAVPGDAERADEQETPGEQSLRNKLRASLKRNGIPNPEAILEKVRAEVLKLEQAQPELSHSARLNMALLAHAQSDYLSKFNSWFDQSVDRVSDLFTKRVWLVTALVSMVLAFAVQLDSITLMNRLSTDKVLRDKIVAAAMADPESLDPAKLGGTTEVSGGAGQGNEATAADGNDSEAVADAPTNESAGSSDGPANGSTAQGQPKNIKELNERIDAAGYGYLREVGLIAPPKSVGDWWGRWKNPPQGFWPFLFGILLSAALLSLGGPFWYSALANLLKLRSVASRKEEVQRAERQTTQLPVVPVVPVAP